MKETLKAGLTSTLEYKVSEARTVPKLYPDAPEFGPMPAVFATGYLVGLVEWACMRLVVPHLDWPKEQSVGTDVRLDHKAPTPPGLTVTVTATLRAVDGRRLRFDVSAHDGVDEITRGTHERYVIDSAAFAEKVAKKAAGRLSR
jgi:fluoroacetyl-CoA thioesterase